jgi:hypothetical protein
MVEEEVLDQEDYYEQQDNIEDQQDQSENVEWADVPQRRKQDSLYTLFQKVWRAQDSSKVANLGQTELGKPLITVRDAQYLNLLGTTFHHKKFGAFFNKSAEIILATSASKKGWFTELFVSQRKFTSRSVGGGSADASKASQKRKWNIFGGGGGNEGATSEQQQS